MISQTQVAQQKGRWATLCRAKHSENWSSDSKSTAYSQFNIEEPQQLNRTEQKKQRLSWHQESFPSGTSQASRGARLTPAPWCTRSAALHSWPTPARGARGGLRATASEGSALSGQGVGKERRASRASRGRRKRAGTAWRLEAWRDAWRQAPRRVTVKAGITRAAGAGRTIGEVILIITVSSEGYSVDI